jgi:hypothetical protein
MTTKAQVERALSLGATDTEISNWIGGELIQVAMKRLSEGEREYILTGITEEEGMCCLEMCEKLQKRRAKDYWKSLGYKGATIV